MRGILGAVVGISQPNKFTSVATRQIRHPGGRSSPASAPEPLPETSRHFDVNPANVGGYAEVGLLRCGVQHLSILFFLPQSRSFVRN